jgi:hypothetical protein
MNRSIRFFLVIIFLSISGFVFSQPAKQFSKDPLKFHEELKKMFETTQSPDQKESGGKLILEFTTLWNTNKFAPDMKDSIYTMCNIMLNRKMKTYPNFEDYISAVILFSKSNQSEESYGAWQFALRKLAAMTNNIRFLTLLECTNSLLSEKALYKSQLIKWKSNSDEFFFKYDSTVSVVFPALDLTCLKKNDCTIITKTKGVYFPISNKWKGDGGTVTWARAGLPETEVWAEFKKYNITINKSEFKIDTVKFYNTTFFQRPLYGSLEEKVFADVSEDRVSYPRFTSFDKLLKIKEIFKNIDYEGGFAMYGAKLIGIGDKETDANIFIRKDNKRFIKLGAKRFIIRKESISSDLASASIYCLKDSIYHPGLIIKYMDEEKTLTLMRDKDGIAASPYFDSYHKIDIYVEFITWKLDEPKMDFRMALAHGSENTAVFESSNYFSKNRYEKLQALDETHPLFIFKQISIEKGSKTFTIYDVQNKMKVAMNQVINLLLRFAVRGFLIYDKEDETVTLTNRVFDYVNANMGKTDYDIIRFESTIASTYNNATLSLLNFDLKLRGVPRVALSDSQNVYVIPTEQELILKKNRDFVFDGKIRSGLFDFYTKKSYFNYDMFKIDLPVVDSMSFLVQDRSQPIDIYGLHPFVKVKTVIEDLTGDLLIDGINNKSGRISFADFPIFNSKKDAYAYYNKSYIQGGVYTKDKFYYRIYPFRIDSLDDPESERKLFKGYLVSAGIFQDINEPLRVQPDFSLGFVMTTPPGGYPAYGGKAKYDSIIDLSFKGFLGRGTLSYLTSVTKSNDIIFFPDSLYANAFRYEIKEKATPTEYPPVYVEDVKVQYYPYRDRMDILQKDKPFTMYTNQTILKGNLMLTSKELRGFGNVSFGKVEMTSNNYLFKHHSYSADTADVKFKTPDLSDVVLSTQNFNVNIDFKTQIGKFKSNDEESRIRFPFNSYSCNNYNFDWYMEQDQLELISSQKAKLDYLKDVKKEERIGVDYSASEFVSEHPGQDSLRFYSPTAKYNLTENVIRTKDIPVIMVADAAIYPDSGKVTILKKAEMLTLEKAYIIANFESRFHRIYDARLNIISRKQYSGDGNYDYVDEMGDKQKIFLKTIKVDTAGQTIGSGDIVEKENFTLSPFFGFIGNANLAADKEFLFFNGGCRIKHNCDTLYRPWLRFKSDIDPKNIMIPVAAKSKECLIDKDAKVASGKELGNGLYVTSDTSMIYSAFLQYKTKSSDSALVRINGFLVYDKANQVYTISPIIDSTAKYLPAATFSQLDKKTCTTTADGEIRLGTNLGRLDLRTFGVAKHNIVSRASELDLVLQMDFFLVDDIMNYFIKAIESQAGTEDVDQSSDLFYNYLKIMLGPEKADKTLSKMTLKGRLGDLPSELTHTFVFSDVKFNWNAKTRSLVSDGTIGIVSINKTEFYKKVDGYIEIARKNSGNIINMYFEIGNDWYFFNYQANKLQVLSSKKDFNDLIKKAVEEGKNQLKAEDNLPAYVFMLSTNKRKTDFYKKIKPEGDEEEENNDE